MQKAQVFSLESNTSVRNRLTHSLEVADIGRTLARQVGQQLEAKGIAGLAGPDQTECMQSIVENACLVHDIGNPPFGHFGEEAIKRWFREKGAELISKLDGELPIAAAEDPRLSDFLMFDGNPQGFRIVTRLHCDVDQFGLNLTYSTLLASVKYPNSRTISPGAAFPKKLGIFSSEAEIYRKMCQQCCIVPGNRYFLAYLTELADDICYCLSDIADAFEKRITASQEFKNEFKKICDDNQVDWKLILPESKIENFGYQVSIKIAQRIIKEASEHFSSQIDRYIAGNAKELSEQLPSGRILKCLKIFARRFIYTDQEAQRIEIAGSRVVEGLLDHFGRLLKLPRPDFEHFVKRDEMRKGSGWDIEWRIYKQLSRRMIRVYEAAARDQSNSEEWVARARLIVDYISGLTDNSALRFYQNLMGISL